MAVQMNKYMSQTVLDVILPFESLFSNLCRYTFKDMTQINTIVW